MQHDLNDSNNAKDAAEHTMEFIQKMSYDYDPLLIAAFLVICGLGLYKNYLSDKEYQLMCEKIYTDKDKIKKVK